MRGGAASRLRAMRRLPVLALSLSLTGCSWLRQTFATNPGPKAAAGVPRPIAIKSFSDTVAVNALVASGKTLWVGTPRGLIKWDVEAGTSSRVTARDGLPGNRVTALLVDGANTLWVATSGGLAHQVVGKGGATSWRSFPNPPVGESVTAIAR